MNRNDSVAMLTIKMSAGIAPMVNLRNPLQAMKHASRESALALKLRADINRSSNGGISGPTERTHVLQIKEATWHF